MRTRTFASAGAAVALAVLLAGCGPAASTQPAVTASPKATATATATKATATTKAPTPTPTKTPVGPPGDGGNYATALELKAAVEAAGLPCAAWVEQSLKYASSGGNCTNGSDILAIYPSKAALDEQLAVWTSFGKMAQMKVLVGKNWTVNSASADQLQKNLGGQIFTTPGK
jgi:hypothetical protein